jgi:ferrochelatase
MTATGVEAPSAVLLLNMGGPDSEEAVEPFLANLFSDPAILPLPLPGFLRSLLARSIARRRAVKVMPRYRALGGKSPQNEITARQAGALAKALRTDGSWKVFYAMRYWNPRAERVLEKIFALEPRELVVISLYPHYSKAVGGSSLKEVRHILRRSSPALPVRCVEEFHRHPLFIEAHAGRIADALSGFPHGGRDTFVLFSAHNLPEKLVRQGDPYLDQVRATVDALLPAIADRPWSLAFQSRSGPVRWLKPETLDTLRELAAGGRKEVLLVPLSFVCDQIETLYEIDGYYTEEAHRLGIEGFRRTAAFNDSEDFIALLRALALEGAKGDAA